jgi:acyl carrier protein
MNKETFFNELIDILELDDSSVNEESEIHLTSLSTLSVMAFVYDNFEKQVKASDLQKVDYVKDLIDLIGSDKFS